MEISFDIAAKLDSTLRLAAAKVEALGADFAPELRPADPRFGDYQANGVLPCAKKQKTNPRALATQLLEALRALPEWDESLISTEIAGPGFINFRLSAQFLQNWLKAFSSETDFQENTHNRYTSKKVVIDYPSPNTAKQMHIGHLRPLCIGEAVQRLLRFSGAELVRDNHIGDWGTNFGTLIMAIKRQGFDLDAPGENPIEAIEALYKEGSALEKEMPELRDTSRNELVKLQNNDPENVAIWKRIVEISNSAFEEIYSTLKIESDVVLGESFYRDKVDRVYDELLQLSLAEESDGALVVWHDEVPRFSRDAEHSTPFIIRKKDGASNYASTDLATLLYRLEHFEAEEIVYVTDGRQQDHFQQLFLTTEKWFTAKSRPLPKLHHVWFGMILGEDNKAIKTKSGQSIKLKELLNEAVERAYAIVAEKNPSLSEEEKQTIARTVGLSAVRYADLSPNRTANYVFAWDKLLSFEGNTAPYLLYAVARIHAIFRKAEASLDHDFAHEASQLETDEELALARKLVSFPNTLELTLNELRPHFLCSYLYELAGQFSSFYNANKVIVDDIALQNRRLLLCARTLSILKTGLGLLGIETLERM